MTTYSLPQQTYGSGEVTQSWEGLDPFSRISVSFLRQAWPSGLCLSVELDLGGGRVSETQFNGGQLKTNKSAITVSGGTVMIDGEQVAQTFNQIGLKMTFHQTLSTEVTITTT